MPRVQAIVNGTNFETAYGLRLVDYDIGDAEPDLKLISVHGRAEMLDATLALNGKINYLPRPVSANFRISGNSYADYHTLKSTLSSLYNGKELKVKFSTDPDWYYKGRFTLKSSKANPVSSNFFLFCNDCCPYKLEEYVVADTVSGSKNIVCAGKEYNSMVTINVSAAMQVTVDSITYSLVTGDNILREVHLANSNKTFHFSGNGNVRIKYERGIL